MGLLDRRRKRANGARVLTASGLRITSGNVDAMRRVSSQRQEWQGHAWGYRDLIGELRNGLQYQCRAVGRVMFVPAEINPDADEPWLFDADESTLPDDLKRAAEEELARLPLDSASWKARLAENLAVPGEVWLHGHEGEDELEAWDVRSVDEVEVSADGRIALRDEGAQAVELDLEADDLLRLWQPHPRRYWQADSALRALLDTCEDIVLIGKELRAASRSRIASNGVLMLSETMALRSTSKHHRVDASDDGFIGELTQAMLMPISNEGDPGSVMPVVITGDAEDIAAARHVTFAREDSPRLLDKLDRALKRLGNGMDIPAEIITGLADVNHWTAWQVDASTFRHHIEPLTRIVDDALAVGYLRTALRARGFPAVLVARVTVWHDAGNLTENPNRGADAKDAFERGAIGYKALRDALGFADGDAPDDDELARMIAYRAGVPTEIAAQVLAVQLGRALRPAVIDAQPARPAIEPPAGTPPESGPRAKTGAPGEAPDDPVPTDPGAAAAQRARAEQLVRDLMGGSPALTAAGEQLSGREYRVDEGRCRELFEIERTLRTRVTVAADAALRRGIERASARARSHANGNRTVLARLREQPDVLPTRVLGRAECLALGVDGRALLDAAFDALKTQFYRWVTAAMADVVRTVLAMLDLPPDAPAGERMTKRFEGNLDAGWARLEDALFARAERELFDPSDAVDDNPEPGELGDTLLGEGDVRAALATIGEPLAASGGIDDDGTPADDGGPIGGLAQGEIVEEAIADEGGEGIGFEWHYGITPRERHFEPHRAMHLQRFLGWNDPDLAVLPRWPGFTWVGTHFRTGDHRNCSCDYMPLWALPQHAEVVEANTARDRGYMPDDRRLAEDDDAQPGGGYPTGPTTAQETRDERERVRLLQETYITERNRNRR